MSTTLNDLPEDTLLRICDYVQPEALLSLSYISIFWNNFCIQKVWPRRIASTLGVRALNLHAATPNSSAWFRLLKTFITHSTAATLCICVQLAPSDTVTSLALQYSVTPHHIFRTNSLFTDHQLASRTHLYIPLLSENSVLRYTGTPTSAHTPLLVREKTLSTKSFLVAHFRPSPNSPSADTHTRLTSQSYVRHLVVKLIAKRLSLHQDEVRFYLEDTHFDLPKAYEQLLADHHFAT